MNAIITEYSNDLTQLLNGSIKPRSIIGTGYKNPKSVASAWLRQQIVKQQKPSLKIGGVFVTASGKAFTSIDKAKKSKIFKVLTENNYQLFADSLEVDKYWIEEALLGGYMIVFTYKKINSL